MTRAIWLAVCAVLAPSAATAHFKLMAPASATQQNNLGDPQKTAPCGGAGTATNMVTAVQTGSMLAVTIDETIFHPGHYRIAIAQTAADLPAPPPVTPSNNDPCASVPIAQTPTLPVLADGVFAHTQAFNAPQSTQIQLPAGYTCENCVVQVLQYMRQHAAPCFYYHCATVTISDSAPPPPDAGVTPGDDAGTTGGGGEDAGGCCETGRSTPGASALLGLLVLGLALRRRG